MKNILNICLVLICLYSPSVSQESLRVSVPSANPGALQVLFESAGFDVLHGHQPGAVEMVVSPLEKDALEQQGYEVSVLEVGHPFSQHQNAGDGTGGYPDLAQVLTAMSDAESNHPGICQVVDLTATYGLPQTFDGRNIMAVKISDNVTVSEDEPTTLLAACHHAREIITPVIALHALDQLTSLYGTDPAITSVVDSQEIWIIPVVNVDGYEHVFNSNNMWRKNRHVFNEGVGVDNNRNYPLGWDAPCSGSSNQNSGTYKGPAAASETENQTVMSLSLDRRFSRVLDFHSSGREVLWTYNCLAHPFDAFFLSEAIDLSNACGYGGDERPPSAEGEHQEWHLSRGVHAFLIETGTSFQPSFADAVNEANMVWGGIQWMLGRPMSVSGHVTDPSGNPLDSEIEVLGVNFTNGETYSGGGAFGRYDLVLPPGNWILRFKSPGFLVQDHSLVVTGSSSQVLDVALGNLPSANGQPNTSTADFEITGAVDGSGFVPGLGQNGPFFASLSQSDLLEMHFSGQPNQGFLLVLGNLNPGNAIAPGMGSLDVGMGGGSGDYSDIVILLNGLQPATFLDGFAHLDAGGQQFFNLGVPALPPGILGTLQGIIGQSSGLPLLTAAVQIILF